MVIGLGIDVSFAEKRINFVFKSLSQSKKRNQVRYHLTLKKVFEHSPDQLIIPEHIKDCDYNYETLIEHIRTESNQAISRIPILVCIEDDNKFNLDDYIERKLEYFAVNFSSNPKVEDFNDKFDEKAFVDYKKKDCYREPYNLGNHDKTNLWGSLSLLKSLSHIYPDNKDLLRGISELEDNLSDEATYFKRLIRELNSTNVDKASIGRLRSESSKLTKISNNKTVLIIEDQLKDGWEVAYGLFFQLSSNFEVIFAESESEAENIIDETKNDSTKNIDLILLDVRLDKDRDNYNQDEYGHHVENLSGVKLAKWIHSEMPTIPIIAATASNKSWTLEALLEQGINGYWVKGSPNLVTNAEVGIENTLALINKIHDTLRWEQETGHWQNELYRIAEVVNEVYLEGKGLPIFHKHIRDKAKSLQSLLWRSFSPFSQELSDGLQLNLAFIIIYSCMNDLVEWACDKEKIDPGLVKWKTLGDSNGVVDDELIAKVKKIKVSKWDDWEWSIPNIDEKFERMPDKKIAIRLLTVKFGESGDSKFSINHKKKRVVFMNKELTLTLAEFIILSHLVKYPFRAHSREYLMNIISDRSHGLDITMFNTHIESIRKRLHELDEDNEYIKTYEGIGYSLFGGSKIRGFNELTNKRNALPLIHGKRLPSGSGSELKFDNINISDIDNLINLLGSLADRHRNLLDKYGG